MTKTMTIEIEENDEFVLLEIFKKFKVKIKNTYLTNDQQVIRENLRQKYVTTGEWEEMSLEEKEDAVLNEQIELYQPQPKVEMDKVLDYLKSKIANE